MTFEDFFEKSGPSPSSGQFRPRSFDPPGFSPPVESEPSGPSPSAAFFAGLVSVILLSFTEGTLLWVAFESLEDLGAIDTRLPWHPFIIITFAVNLIRVFDRSSFGKR